MHYAQKLASDSLPPVCAEFCPKVADCVVVEFGLHLEQQASLLFAVYLDAFVRCLEVERKADKVAVFVVVQKSALHVQRVGKADSLGHFAEGVCIAHGAVQDKARVLALGRDNVKLADGRACGPVPGCICCAAVERGDPTLLDFFVEKLLQQCGVLLGFSPVALAVQEVCPVEVIVLQVWLALLPLHARGNVLKNACRDP